MREPDSAETSIDVGFFRSIQERYMACGNVTRSVVVFERRQSPQLISKQTISMETLDLTGTLQFRTLTGTQHTLLPVFQSLQPSSHK